jgi:hypothetical protein
MIPADFAVDRIPVDSSGEPPDKLELMRHPEKVWA